jgi:hypothetical protein
MRRPRRRWRDPAPPPAGESRSPGSSPRYETPSRARSPRRPVALHARAHHGALPLCIPALTTALSTALDRSPRRLPSLFPTGALGNPRRHPSRRPVHKASTRASRVRTPHRSNETLRPSEPNMDLPPRMQVLTTTLHPLPHSPTELRPSAERRAERLRPSAGHGGQRHAAAGAGRRHPPPRAGATSLDCP